jgi:hypothetical protein
MWFRARWPDEIAISEALAKETSELLDELLDQMATKIANRMNEMLAKAMK